MAERPARNALVLPEAEDAAADDELGVPLGQAFGYLGELGILEQPVRRSKTPST